MDTAAPVYLASVIEIDLLSFVVHVRVVTAPVGAAENVPETAVAVFAPSIPCATAMLVATSARTPAIANVSLRMRLDLPSDGLGTGSVGMTRAEPAKGT